MSEFASLETDTTEECSDIELNAQCLKVVEKLCYLGVILGIYNP